MNNVSLIGRLTSDITIKNINEKTNVSKFLLAVPRDYKDREGNQITDFVNCEIWNEGAKTLKKYTSKGSLLGISGEIHTGKFEDDDGKTIYTTLVSVKKFNFLEPLSKKEERSNNNNIASPEPPLVERVESDVDDEDHIYFDNAEKYDQNSNNDDDDYHYMDSNNLFR